MTQTLAGLRREAASIKDQRKVGLYKKQVSELHEKLRKQKEQTRAEEVRAELAERQVRQITAEKDIWKHRAQEAEARLKSTGRAP
jgi:hypothetical protein